MRCSIDSNFWRISAQLFWSQKENHNKKVLLRERKRHTARRVAIASPCYSGGGILDKKFFSQSEHVSSQIWCQKFFPLLRPGTPPWTWTWDPPYPDLDLGPPLPRPGLGTPPYPDLDLGPPPRNVNRQTPVKTVPSRHTTYAGGNNRVTRLKPTSSE